jgi:peptide chain release factor subunit 1
MFSDNDLRELLEFKSSEPVLSLYLNTDLTEENADAYRLRLRNMLKEINLPEDVSAVEHYFNHQFDWSGRAVAVFSCSPQSFFRTYPLALPVRNLIRISDRPSMKPLADLLDTFGGYGVALVDKQGARLFFFHLGELREQEGVLGELVKHTKRGGASSFPGRQGGIAGRTNRMEEKIERNLKDSAEFAAHFFEENHVRRVLIGGTDENVASFRSLLPKSWQSLVMGTFPMSMTASHTDVLSKALQIGKEAEHQREHRLVEHLITTAAKGGGAVVGSEGVFDAINHDRVKALLVEEGMPQPGYVCNACGALYVSKQDPCALCGKGKVERTQDAIEMAVSGVMRRGGEIDIVRASPDLNKVGSIGALLRY